MSLTFSPMNNQATAPITTANSSTLATLTSTSTIITAVVSLASGMVSIYHAPAISVAATGKDANFKTTLNAMQNAIFKLESTLEIFISTDNLSGTLQKENDSGYLTDSSVNASQYEIDQSSDDESNCGTSPQKKPSTNAANIEICRASKDVFDKDIICWCQMKKSRTNQVRRTVQQMI